MAPSHGTSVNGIPSRGNGLAVTTGICRAPGCPKAAGAEPIALYPGPGEHCPDCGSRLEPVVPGPPEAPAPLRAPPEPEPAPAASVPQPAPPEPTVPPPGPAVSAPLGAADSVQPELISLEAYQRAHERMMATLAPAAPEPARSWPRTAVVVLVAGFVLALAAGLALGPRLTGRTAAAQTVRVCASSITERLERDLVRSYAAANGLPAARFGGPDAGGCDVRFAARIGPSAAAVAHDGIVVVVNPQNGLARLSEDQVRDIFSGQVSDWAQVGGQPGAIVPILPDEATDEARALGATLLLDAKPGAGVRRLPSSADVTREVAGASGRREVGVVAFSAAVPAKVLALRGAPAPSVLSIAAHRYPLALAITVDAGDGARGGASGLVDYAHSEQAQAIVVRDGLIARKGF